jgi:protein-disulfide isomerase
MKRNSLAPILAVAGGAIVLVIALVIASNLGGSKSTVDTSKLQMVSSINEMLNGIPQQGTAIGNPKAKLTLVEFGDLQCSACSWFSENVLPEVIQNYVRKGKLRIEFEGQTIIDYAHHDSARLLKMALAAGAQNRLWNFAEIAYANQGSEDSGYATDSYLKSISAAVPGLDTTKAFSVSQTSAFAGAIEKSHSRFDALRFPGTPSFLLYRTGEKATEKITGSAPTYQSLATRINVLLRS